MKSVFLTLLVVTAGLFSVSAQNTSWKIDKSHSEIGFKVRHMLIAKVSGEFNEYQATIVADKEDFSDAKVEFTAQVSSINTGIEKRDEHLKSEDFFHAEKYPAITFKSTSIEKVKDNQYKMTGNLTIKDVTKSVTLNVIHGGTVKDPNGNTRAGFEITGTINRFDYNIEWSAAMEDGGFIVDEEVDFDIAIEVIKQ